MLLFKKVVHVNWSHLSISGAPRKVQRSAQSHVCLHITNRSTNRSTACCAWSEDGRDRRNSTPPSRSLTWAHEIDRPVLPLSLPALTGIVCAGQGAAPDGFSNAAPDPISLEATGNGDGRVPRSRRLQRYVDRVERDLRDRLRRPNGVLETLETQGIRSLSDENTGWLH